MTVSTTNQFRPPIVTVLGHIDHGKTTLLDKIRSSHVAAREAGGITQHITAYQSHQITFIDTPGHAAFCQMRVRGVNATDIALLVISAVDGVMAQTKECINQIKKANLPLIIALNKIDLPQTQLEKVKGQLVELDLTPEEYGGQTPVIPVSAKTGQGIDKLLESIRLHADIMELKDEPTAPLEAVVIESRVDSKCGPVALAIVKRGTLKLGDQIYADNVSAKVKALINSDRQNITQALPGTPVEILGFASAPLVGSLITDHPSNTSPAPSQQPLPPNSTTPRLPIVLKADVAGTLEALKNSFSDDVKIIHAGTGPVSDNDIFLAKAAAAPVFAFNVSVPKFIQNLADNEKVNLFSTKIIYEIIETVQNQVLKMLEPTIDETILGEANIIAEFNINKVRIAGIKCAKGEIKVGDLIHLKRGPEIIKNTKIEGIHQQKNIVPLAKAGHEYGVTFRPYVDFKLGDVIIAYKT